MAGTFDIAYGDHPRQTLDLFIPGEVLAPVIVFFHGGYWTAGKKDTRRFPAAAWLQRGVAWCTVQYRLAPEASIAEIVADARRAVHHIASNADALGISADQIHVAGNSAGGHLAAMAAAADWAGTPDLDRPSVRSLTAVSGLFDLAPLFHERANDWLSADLETLRASSPIHNLPGPETQVIVGCGGDESDAFKGQSRDFAKACKGQGLCCTSLESPGAGHFDVIADFGDPNARIFRAMAEAVGCPQI